jgi:SPASM domain peptide maturase of grasp-with-spasm system
VNKKYFKFYESCIPVIGINRGVVYDLGRGAFYFLPKNVLQIFYEYASSDLEKFHSDYEEQKEILDKYFNYLIDNELIFLLEDKNRFPKINTKLLSPFILDVLFLEIDNFDFCIKEILKKEVFNKLGCSELILISYQSSIKNLEEILMYFENSKVHNITIFMNYDFEILNTLNDLSQKNSRIREIIIFDVEEDSIIDGELSVKYCKNTLSEILTKRISSIRDFVPNLKSYLESLEKNLFFNKKAYIDNNGNVKHGLEDETFYGNLNERDIYSILEDEGYKKLWNVTKDQIEICKDCEFRYICPDNRIPLLETTKSTYVHTSECNYNPYTNRWK